MSIENGSCVSVQRLHNFTFYTIALHDTMGKVNEDAARSEHACVYRNFYTIKIISNHVISYA